MTDSPDHTAAPGMWSYSCRCLRCRWEQWWYEEGADKPAVGKPTEPHPDYPETRNTDMSHAGVRPGDRSSTGTEAPADDDREPRGSNQERVSDAPNLGSQE